MLTRTQFLIMLAMSIAGIVFAYALPDLVDWTFRSELGALLFCVCVVVIYIALVGNEEHKRDEAMNKEMHEERKVRVAKMIQDNIDKKNKESVAKK